MPKGFTLIELMLYISLSTVILLTISFFIFTAINSRIKNQVIAQVEQQGLEATEEITQSLRNALSINEPSPGTQSSQLSINGSEKIYTPTLFDLSENQLRLKEAEAPWIALTHPPVLASGLYFKNMASSGSLGSIQFQFTLTYTNPMGKKEYDYGKTFSATASLRENQ